MAYFDVQMNGARDYVLRLHVNVASQNYAANTSVVNWILEARGTWGSFGNYSTSWSVNIGGQTRSGTIGSFNPNPYQTIASGSVTITHNADGNKTIYSSGYWDSRHSNIGAGTTGGNYTLPRIPKPPAAPTPIGIDQVTSSSFRYRFSGNSNNGAAVDQWQAQLATNSSFTTGVRTVTSTGTTVFTDLPAGVTYWVRSRGHNSRGWGAWSSSLSVKVGLPAPALNSWVQNASGGLVASWSAPSATNGLTGYRLQIARDAGFTTGVVSYDVGNVLTHTVTGLAGGRIWYARVAARTAGGVNAYSGSRNVMLVLSAGDLDGWIRVGTKPANISYFTAEGLRRGTSGTSAALYLESLSTGSATLAADTYGIHKLVTGLTVGKAYRFEANATRIGSPRADSYRLRVLSEGSADPVTVTTSSTSLGYIEFVADASTAVLQILLAEPVTVTGAVDEVERVAFTGMRLLELATDYPVRLRETVYESDLANHFDLACNSVGASWTVGKDGVTRFVLPGTALPVTATFTDETLDSALHYVDIAAARDTRGMFNRMDVTNYGVTLNEDGERVEENDELVVSSDESIQKYGTRSVQLSTNLYSDAPYDESLDHRLTELLDENDQPQFLISQLRWNAQEDLAMAQALDVGQRLTVRRKGIEQDSQIVALTHDITPERWMVTIDLRKLGA
jgi:hypothetical protein